MSVSHCYTIGAHLETTKVQRKLDFNWAQSTPIDSSLDVKEAHTLHYGTLR